MDTDLIHAAAQVAGIEANTTPNATRNNANQRIFPNGRAGSV